MKHKKYWISLLFCFIFLVVSTAAFTSEKTNLIQYGKGYRFEENGWIFIHIEGDPYERGYQHGYLSAAELQEILRTVQFIVPFNTGMEWQFFVDTADRLFTKFIDPELVEEMRGIADGATAAGTPLSFKEILAWNGYEELIGYWWPTKAQETYNKIEMPEKEHCSAFIATGSITTNHNIVIAHNSWNDFVCGQFMNFILEIVPSQGNRILMQSSPGFIDSFADFFITGAGIVGVETTIGGFNVYEENEAPEFYRARKAMQYGNSLDDFVAIMKKQNNGGYANSWLLGDIKSGEIMRFELGLKFFNIERKKDGYFIGINAAFDDRIRNLECVGSNFVDIRKPSGSRRVRLTQLMNEYKGKIDIDVAQKILADHYDVYLEKEKPGYRTIDSHYYLDAFEYVSTSGTHPVPFEPFGTLDGKVTDSNLAQQFAFWGRWGNSSGMEFNATQFINEHPQWEHLTGYLKDRPSQPWTFFQAGKIPE